MTCFLTYFMNIICFSFCCLFRSVCVCCSNDRGLCDLTTGLCTCDTGYVQSNGQGGGGYIPDCGYANGASNDPGTVNITTCPGHDSATDPPTICSGNGNCLGAGGEYKCQCLEGFTGYACLESICPKGRAWFDEATGEYISFLLLQRTKKMFIHHLLS